MTARLTFSQKIAILPVLAVAACLLILLVAIVLSAQDNRIMHQIEKDYYPSLELNRDVDQNLAIIQRGLQDGALFSSLEEMPSRGARGSPRETRPHAGGRLTEDSVFT